MYIYIPEPRCGTPGGLFRADTLWPCNRLQQLYIYMYTYTFIYIYMYINVCIYVFPRYMYIEMWYASATAKEGLYLSENRHISMSKEAQKRPILICDICI